MKKPNYNMERKDRDRAKQAKATAKLENRAMKRDENGQAAAANSADTAEQGEAEKQKPGS